MPCATDAAIRFWPYCSEEPGSISTSSSDNSHSLEAICSLCWEGYIWDYVILKLCVRTAHYMNPKVFLSCHHSHSLMLIALHSVQPSPVHLGPQPLQRLQLRAGWPHRRETRLQQDRDVLGEQSWRPAARADIPFPFLAGSVHLVRGPNFTELQFRHLCNRNKPSIWSRHTEQLVNISC